MANTKTSALDYSNQHHRIMCYSALFEAKFSIDWVIELGHFRPSEVLNAMEEGVNQKWLINEKNGFYSFSNFKIRQNFYRLIQHQDIGELHQKATDILIRDAAHDPNISILLSKHLLHIQNDLSKCKLLIEAGNSYLKASDYKNSRHCFAKAIKDLSDIEGEEADRLFINTVISSFKISPALEDTSWFISVFRKAVEKAENLKDTGYQGLLTMYLAINEGFSGRMENAEKFIEQGRTMALSSNNTKVLQSISNLNIFYLYWYGNYKEVIDLYEETVPPIAPLPHEEFPLLTALTTGVCYVYNGHVTQGLGMLHAIYDQINKTGNLTNIAFAGNAFAEVFLEMGYTEKSIQYYEISEKNSAQSNNALAIIGANIGLAYAYSVKGDDIKSVRYLTEAARLKSRLGINLTMIPIWIEILWAIEIGSIPKIESFVSKDVDINIFIREACKSRNKHTRGLGYYIQALQQKRSGIAYKKVIDSLKLSSKWLLESGHEIKLAKVRILLIKEYLHHGEEQKAKKLAYQTYKFLSTVNDDLIPDELRSLTKDIQNEYNLLKDILSIGQEIVRLRDPRELVQKILSTANRITGAERGAIFIIDGDDEAVNIRLHAAKNLSEKDLHHPDFSFSMKTIKNVARNGAGRIEKLNHKDAKDVVSTHLIRSIICLPMIIKGKVTGVLYHDNRLLNNIFRETDLEILAFFAAQAAIALENAQAFEDIRRLSEKVAAEKKYFEEQHLDDIHFENIIGKSRPILEVFYKIDHIAKSDTTGLILGETGVGKELVARAMHHRSVRKNKAFIRVNCSALPESLISTELFGHEKGAFTGAASKKVGRFELADGGTLFLDEIGEIPLEIQVRLLRVIQYKEFERVGGIETIKSDFRLIAATNKSLLEQVKIGKFREDLYYRLNVFPILVPPLRERKDDIPLIAQYFLNIYAKRSGKSFKGINEKDMNKLIQYDWPGNVRELENVIERCVILSSNSDFHIIDFNPVDPQTNNIEKVQITLEENERRYILSTLEKTGWKVQGHGGAAELLDIHHNTLFSRMKKLKIERPHVLLRHRSGALSSV